MYDIIIIGSGLGGLECAYILSKAGLKVLIVEKNAQIGGCLQTFKRFGVKFDTGIHYIGSLNEGAFLHRLFNYFNLFKDIELSELNPAGYDICCIGGKNYQFAAGYEHFEAQLSKSFPENRTDIKRYVQKIKEIAEQSPIYDITRINNPDFFTSEPAVTSVNDFIASFTNNRLLQNVLAANRPLYGGVKDESQAYIHAIINNSYMQGAYRIVGGGDTIAHSLANSIRNFGGEILTHSEVTEIVCDNEKATAIRLADGQELYAKAIISNIHPVATLQKLHTPLLRKAYRERIRSLPNTISNFTVYIKFKENSVPYLNSNFYYYENEDVWSSPYYLYMPQCHKTAPEYAQSAILIGSMSYREVAQWADSTIGNRGADYQEFKQKTAANLLAKLEETFPNIRNNIEAFETSSPLTYQDYTATYEGSTYGILHNKNSPLQSMVAHKTKIPNLFFTGQNIYAHGILGVTVGALITCNEFVPDVFKTTIVQ
jgi:all-trans-retinol 13,14-reductase